jgi:anti-anti-sigma factor
MAELTDPADQAPVRVEVREENKTPVIRLSGELDMTSVEQVRSAIDATVGAETERIVFDAADLEFIDSSGIALLVSVTRGVREVEVRNPHPIVRRIIELTGLDQILQITS